MIEEALQAIGLSDKEAKIYLSLIGLGPQPVSAIARQSGIRRTTAYSSLETLMKKGLVSSLSKTGVTYFKCLDPRRLPDYLEQERLDKDKQLKKSKENIEALMPALISLEHPASTKPKVRFFEGEKGVQQAYEDTLSTEGEILAYANIKEMHECLPNFFPEYYRRRSEKDIHIKAILPDNEHGRKRALLDKKENRETRLISEAEFDFSPELNVYNNKVLIASWREQMALIIESEEIAELHRKIFKLAWEKATEMNDPSKG